MFKKLLPIIAIAFLSACAPEPTGMACECSNKSGAECMCCKDGKCDKCKGKKGKHGKQCPPKEGHKH